MAVVLQDATNKQSALLVQMWEKQSKRDAERDARRAAERAAEAAERAAEAEKHRRFEQEERAKDREAQIEMLRMLLPVLTGAPQ